MTKNVKVATLPALDPNGATASPALERIPSIPVLHKIPKGKHTHKVEDDCFAPLIFAGDTVIIDPAKTSLDDGEIYALKQVHQRKGETLLWLAENPENNLGGGDRDIDVWLLTLGKPYRWRGPCKREAIDVLGRVVGLLDSHRSIVPERDLVMTHEAERRWCFEMMAALRLQKFGLERALPKHLQEPPPKNPSERPAYHAERMVESEKSGLAELYRRDAAVTSRFIRAEDMIIELPGFTPDDALAKLQTSWFHEEQHHTDDDRDQGGTALKGAIEALGGEAFYMPWTEEALLKRYGHLAPSAEGPEA